MPSEKEALSPDSMWPETGVPHERKTAACAAAAVTFKVANAKPARRHFADLLYFSRLRRRITRWPAIPTNPSRRWRARREPMHAGVREQPHGRRVKRAR